MATFTIPTTVPTQLTAGDSATWDDISLSHPDYGSFTSTDWTLTYALVGVSANLNVTASAQGTGWRTALTVAQTKALKNASTTTPDALGWTARVTDGAGNTFVVGSGTIRLFANPTTQTGGVASQNTTLLAAVDAAILELITTGVSAFQIQGRGVTKNSLPEMRNLRAQLKYAVWSEQHPGGFGVPIASRFTA